MDNKGYQSVTENLNEEKIVEIFKRGDKKVNNIYMEIAKNDKKLEEIMMRNEFLAKYYKPYCIDNYL